MKQTLKKYMSVALMLICIAALTACGSSQKAEDEGINEELSTNMMTTAEGLTEAIVVLSDEDIASYKESGDEFTEKAMEAWESNRDELGEFKSIGNPAVEEITDGYSVTVPTEFSKKKADLVYTFDEEGTPTDVAVNVEYTLGEKMEQALMNTIMGVGIVFVMLLFLSFLISLFRFIPALEEKFKKQKASETQQSEAPAAPAPAAAAPAVQAQDDSELIAVIAAAIAAYEGTSTEGFVVRSIKKVNRRKW